MPARPEKLHLLIMELCRHRANQRCNDERLTVVEVVEAHANNRTQRITVTCNRDALGGQTEVAPVDEEVHRRPGGDGQISLNGSAPKRQIDDSHGY